MSTQVRRIEEGHNNPAFDPSAVATSLIAMTNLGKTDALEVALTKQDGDNLAMHILMEFLDVVYLILMHAGVIILLYLLLKLTLWIICMAQRLSEPPT